MALRYILRDIKAMLVEEGYVDSEIILNTVQYQSSQLSSLQSSIFIIEESSTPSMTNYQMTDFAVYVRRPNNEDANTVANDIFHKLHNRYGNVNTVSNQYAKIDYIRALSRPYVFSTITTGSKSVEYVIKFRVTYIDTDFTNY